MKSDFATAMRRALERTRAADPAGATAIIQQALSMRTTAGPAAAPPAPAGADPARTPSAPPHPAGRRRLRDRLPFARRRRRAPQAPAPIPQGGRVERRTHSCAAGTREYRLFLPSRPAGELSGLVLMLHGCTQNPEDFARGTGMDFAAEAAGYAVAYPSQTAAHNPNGCWNWFRPGDQTAESGEPALLADLARTLAAELSLEGRVFVAGLSAGGAMAAILAQTHPALFAAAGIHSGLPAGSASDLPSAFKAMRGGGQPTGAPSIPLIVFHGAADAVVAPVNGERLVPGGGKVVHHGNEARSWTRRIAPDGSEHWQVAEGGHAWFGGDPSGTYADPAGPNASAEMLRFFSQIKETK